MSFWTVGDAGPYKEKSNFLMRTSLLSEVFFYAEDQITRTRTVNCRVSPAPSTEQ